jgi:uncharacterized protein (TIGR02145 family)
MEYTSTLSPASEDVTVYGGLFQWGRKDFAHSHRCSKDDLPNLFTETPYSSATYNPSTDTKFVWGGGASSTNSYDWVSDHVDADNRWGNGGDLAQQANTAYNSGTPHTDKNRNNPCPTGFRVPTQDDWAVLMMTATANSSTTTTGDSFSPFTTTNISFTGTRNSNIVWVSVKNGLTATPASWSTSDRCGWAIYNASVWNNYTTDANVDLTGAAAPDPLLYLPAAGCRNYYDGSVFNTGSDGYYWSSTVNGGNGRYLFFVSSYVNANGNGYRANGFSVRCVAE